MKLGLLSDVHAAPGPVAEALSRFREEPVEAILCGGDIAGYGDALEETVALLQASGCRAILGNHDLWWLEDAPAEPPDPVATYLRSLPAVIELTLAGKHLCMVHGSPPFAMMDGIRLLDDAGELQPGQVRLWTDYLRHFDYDVLVVGHTHQVFAEQLGGTLVINPGSTLFNHTCAILSLPEMNVEILPLEGKEPLLSWNWGMLRKG